MIYFMHMPIFIYFNEIKYRSMYVFYSIIITFIIAYIFKQEVFYILSKPLGTHFIYTSLVEAFITHLKIGLLVSIYCTFPLLLYHMWVFILPGLYLYEKKSLRIILLISILLFFLSSQLGYWYIFPVAFDFFLSFQVIGLEKLYHLELQAKMQEYLILNMQLFFSLAFCFQFPIILILLSKLKLITLSWLVQKRKYFYVLAFVLAAIISPPDVISQFIIAIPILLFFECSIFALEWIEMYTKKRLETC